MKRSVRLAAGTSLVGLLALAAPLAAAASPAAASPATAGTGHGVFVQTDAASGNQVVAYDRAGDGTLHWAATYDTGGNGGALNGSVVDHLASQGSLAYDAAGDLLLAVNAGSNTVSAFSVDGDHLRLRQVVSSGGIFPVSIAVSGSLVYVLNALDGGDVAGFWAGGGRLHPIQGSVRSLGLVTPSDANQFTHTPGQVAFTPDGSQLIVTTKASTNAVDVFAVKHSGQLSAMPVVNAEPGTVPFAVTFDGAGRLDLAEAGTNAVASFRLGHDGTLAALDEVATTQAATCWIASARGVLFASNAGSATLSAISTTGHGSLTLLGQTGTDPGTVDAAAAPGGRYLYVQTGGTGTVDGFAVGAGGSLRAVGSVVVPGAAGGEGIVAI